jgi:hypothetical protein
MANPQILYTPQQQMGYGGFSVPCRVGNWAEDEYMGVLLTQQHLTKQGEGMLVSQKLNGTVGTALAPTNLAPAPADGAIRYGDVVMLSAASGGVIAIDTTVRLELPQEAYAVTRTREAGAVACTRTAWTVTAPAGYAPPEDGLLRIGAPFCLGATGGDGSTVYLQSQRCAHARPAALVGRGARRAPRAPTHPLSARAAQLHAAQPEPGACLRREH